MKKFLLSIFCLFSLVSYATAEEVTVTFSEQGYENAQEVTELIINSNLTATFDKGGNSTTPKYYNTGKAYRLYAKNTMTITANNGYTINSVSMTTGSGDYVVNAESTVTSGTLAINGTNATISDINASEVTFTQGGSKGHVRIVTMTVNYSTNGGTVTPDPEEPEGGEGEDVEDTYSTIAEVLAAGAGEAATKGTVVATYARGFLLNDETGSILVYLGSDKGHAVGDAVTVEGATSMYGGLLQFGNTAVVTKTGTATVSHPAATVMDGTAMDAYLAAPSIKYVEYTGTLTISGNYYNIAIDGAATAIGSIQYPQEAIASALTSGTTVKVTGYTIGVSSSKYINTMAVKVETIGNEGEGGDEGEDEEVELTTIAEVLAAGAGEAATKGTVVATYARGFLLNDETGSILVYLGSDKGHAVGDAVTVEGATSMYGGLLQFGNTAVVTKTGTATVSHPAATVMDGTAMDAYLAAPSIKYVEYTGTLTISGNYYNIAIDGAATAIASIQYPQEAIVSALTSGTTVKVTGYTIGVSSSKYVNTMAVKVETIGNEGEGEDGTEEEPAEAKEYTVTEALAAYVDGEQIPAIVTGYIVGAVNSSPEKGSEFVTTTVNTNILISDNPDTNDYTECLIVQLPSGDIRSALNLVENPSNYKKQIKITGSIEAYFKSAGLKSPTAYEFTGVTGIEKIKGENEALTIYDLTGRRIETITTSGIYIVNGKKILVK